MTFSKDWQSKEEKYAELEGSKNDSSIYDKSDESDSNRSVFLFFFFRLVTDFEIEMTSSESDAPLVLKGIEIRNAFIASSLLLKNLQVITELLKLENNNEINRIITFMQR